MAERAGTLARLAAWWRRSMPTRESLEGNRYLKPVAHRVLAPELWRFTRRSVPRGVALGMVTGILFPVAQIFFSALLALPVRANVPVAIAMTFITNPFTTPFILSGAYFIGKWALRLDRVVPGQPVRDAATSTWLQWLMSDAGPAIIAGLLIITLVGAVFSYFLSNWGWRLWIAHKWRHRHDKAHA